MPTHPDFAEMQEYFLPEHRTPEGYGLAFLESEEHSAIYVGPVRQIEEYRAATEGTNPGGYRSGGLQPAAACS